MRSFVFFNGLFYKVLFFALLLSVAAKAVINLRIDPIDPKVTLVTVAIEMALDSGLPPKYEKEIYEAKCRRVYEHVYDAYSGEGISIYP